MLMLLLFMLLSMNILSWIYNCTKPSNRSLDNATTARFKVYNCTHCDQLHTKICLQLYLQNMFCPLNIRSDSDFHIPRETITTLDASQILEPNAGVQTRNGTTQYVRQWPTIFNYPV